jgi:ribosomal protein S18 acetylase RimI-like enzyme
VIGREPLPMRADYARAVQEHRIELLYLGETLAGLIELVLEPDHLLVLNVAVAPEFQGQGHGSTLMRHAEDVARELGYVELRLFTNKAFAPNIKLYQRLGYAIDREEPFMEGFTVYMSKRIAGSSS